MNARTQTSALALAALIAPFVLACRPSGPALATDTDDATTDGQTGNMTTGGPDSTGGSTGSTTSPELCTGDPELVGACDVWCQDCPAGEKCILVGSGIDGIGSWVQTRCQPIDPTAKPSGASCEDYAVENEGEDDCEKGLVCLQSPVILSKDPICTHLCAGSPSNPLCPEPSRCVIYGHFPLCAPLCNPLDEASGCHEACHAIDQFCPDCFPMKATGTFACGLEPQNGGIGSECTAQFCKGNLFCAPPARFPGCDDRCCAPFCDLNAPDCPPETTCFAAFEPGAAPAGVEHVGVCLTP